MFVKQDEIRLYDSIDNQTTELTDRKVLRHPEASLGGVYANITELGFFS
jgi:hypothetical protein